MPAVRPDQPPKAYEPDLLRHRALDTLLGAVNPHTYEDQHILLMGLANLYEDRARPKPAAVTEAFIRLARQAESSLRQILADRIAHADWAPRELVQMLARDEIEIAAPVILSSPLLEDEDLLELLCEASLEHQIHVAQRPNLGSQVIGTLIDQARPGVLVALATNHTAHISPPDMGRLVDLSNDITALKASLARHPALNEALAIKLYPWISLGLRHEILQRFSLDVAQLNRAMQSAVEQAKVLALATDDETAARMVRKLHHGDQLRPAYLIRAAREGRLSLFAYGLATLGDFPIEHIRRTLQSYSARPLFLACTAVGIDRAAFGSLLEIIQVHNQGLPQDPDGLVRSLINRSRQQADHEFRTLMNDLDATSI